MTNGTHNKQPYWKTDGWISPIGGTQKPATPKPIMASVLMTKTSR